MKFIFLGIFVGAFAYTPMYLMDNFVDPQLKSMYQTYSNADEIAAKAAGVDLTTGQPLANNQP